MDKKQIIGASFALLIILSWGGLYLSYNRVKSDAAVIAEFEENRSNFERAVAMALEDASVTAISDDYVLLNGYENWRGDNDLRFSTSRWHEYKKVLRKPGSTSSYTLSKGKDGVISFSTASSSSSYFNDDETLVISKNYAFSLGEPLPLLSSLDWMGDGTANGFDKRFYRRIDEKWFIYFEAGIAKPE